MSFLLKAVGGFRSIDRTEVRRALEILIGPGEYHELRGLGGVNGHTWAHSRLVHAGEWDAACDAAYDLSDGVGVYYTLNPVQATLGDKGASAKHVMARRWLLVDVDRKKTVDPDQSATQGEKDDALSLMGLVVDWLIGEGWPAPVIADSGNGGHLLWRIDLPADRLTHLLLQRALRALATRWQHPRAEIDPRVYDAPRIAKLPGTWARKGIDSPERPHRLAKLLHVPDPIEIVTVDQLEALVRCNDQQSEAKTYDPWKIKTPVQTNRTEAYVRSAIERELARVVLANSGNRNNQLNTAAFALGQLVGAHVLDRQDAERQLAEVGRRSGLGDSEVEKTIKSGLESGIQKPHKLPEATMGPARNGAAKPLPPGTKLTIRASQIKPEKVDWFYENRVAPGFIAIFAGRTGFGKSFVTCEIIAKFSYGFSAPFSSLQHPPMRTLFISEDSPALVLVPRLIELGADLEMVDFMRWEAMGAYTLADVDMLERAYQECGQPQLVVIDPPSSFLGDVDEHRNAEVRGILKLLTAWLDVHRVACIFIMHINKAIGKGLDAVERIIGSVAWGSTARITLAFVKDPDVPDQFMFGGTKNNLGPLAETLAYKVVKTPEGAIIEWVGKVDTTMENALNQVKKKSRGQCATEWLADRFREKCEWESDELKRLAVEAGISKNALWSPEVNALPIEKKKRINASGDAYYVWRSINGWPAPLIGNPGNPGNPEP